jgi:hypothetical protein
MTRELGKHVWSRNQARLYMLGYRDDLIAQHGILDPGVALSKNTSQIANNLSLTNIFIHGKVDLRGLFLRRWPQF